MDAPCAQGRQHQEVGDGFGYVPPTVVPHGLPSKGWHVAGNLPGQAGPASARRQPKARFAPNLIYRPDTGPMSGVLDTGQLVGRPVNSALQSERVFGFSELYLLLELEQVA